MNHCISRNAWKLLALPIAAGVLLSLSSCGNSSAEDSAEKETREDIVSVSVMEITPQDFSETLKLSGTIESYHDIKIAAEMGGKLVKWLVPKGGHVRSGQVIARLDSAMARAQYDAAYAQYRIAQVTYEKQKKVFEQQAISELQMKTFEYQRDAAKAQADQAKAQLEYTIIRSPINGVLNDRFFEEGEMVSPGMPLAHVISGSSLKVAAGVPERYVGRLAEGDRVTFTSDAFPGQEFTGKIAFIASAVNPSNRSIPVEVDVTSGRDKLRPEMIATVRFTLKAIEDAVVVPSDYVQQVDMEKYVAYVVENGKAQERVVTIGSTSNGSAYISEGLHAGDKIITRGFQNVAGGQRVDVK